VRRARVRRARARCQVAACLTPPPSSPAAAAAAAAAAAPSYNFPAITGVDVNPLHLLHELEAVGCPTFRGMKFTDFNLWAFGNCVEYAGGKYDIAYGRDEAMLGGLATGAKGSIGNGFNWAPRVYQGIRRAFFAGDMAAARDFQKQSRWVVDFIHDARFGGNGLATSRVLYEYKNPAVKLGPPRLPIPELSPAQKAAVAAALDEAKYKEWA